MNSPAPNPGCVRDLFDYQNGLLYWRHSPSARIPAGSAAGYLHTGTGAHVITIGGRKCQRSRLVWAWHHRAYPTGWLFHTNRNSADDRIENLRQVTTLELRLLERVPDFERMHGVTRKGEGRYQAQMMGAYIGTFKTKEEAHEAFKVAHIEFYGAASPFAGGHEMSNACAPSTSPPPPFFFENGKPAQELVGEDACHGAC